MATIIKKGTSEQIPYTPETKLKSGDALLFNYTGAKEQLGLSKGVYKIECWGAQGGSYSTYYGGKGGYSVGTLTLQEDTTLFLYVGGQPATNSSNRVQTAGGFNGGGKGYNRWYSSTYTYGQGGGGGSDVRIGTDSLHARVIVAGGGGGSASENAATTKYGGGTSSGSPQSGYIASQTAPGTGGSFGTGGSATTGGSNYKYGSGGGGGGWYGGGACASHSDSTNYRGYNGGGSGYVYTNTTAQNYPSGCLLNEQYYLADAATYAGNTSFATFDGNTETGHDGNGIIKITVIKNNNIIGYFNGMPVTQASLGLGEIKSALLGKTVLWGEKPADVYTELEYIQSTGTQYIDTGIGGDAIGTYEIKFNMLGEAYRSYEMYFAGQLNAQAPKLYLNNEVPIVADIGTAAYTLFEKDAETHIIKATETEIICDGVSKVTYEAKPWGDKTFWIFNAPEQPDLSSTMQLYYLKMYSDGILVRDFIPVQWVDGQIGLYDKVEEQFYPAQGTGEFLWTEKQYTQLVNYQMLYDLGDECTDITGGWTTLSMDSKYQKGGAEKLTTYLRTYELDTGSYGQWGFITQKNIDTTDFVGQGWVSSLPTCTRPSSYTNSAITGMLNYDAGRTVYNNRFYNYNCGPQRQDLIAADPTKVCTYKLFTDFTGGQGSMTTLTGHRFYVSHNCGALSGGIIDVYTYYNWLYAQDDWQTLCEKAGLASVNYEDETSLLSNSTAITTILNNETAVEYMLYTCTGSFLTAFITSSVARAALNSSPYKTQVYTNPHWAKFLNMVA